jgi:PadR family transcriptional regulator PadR
MGRALRNIRAPSTLRCMEPGGTRISQLRRGVLEFCVLSLLAETELYGFDLVRRLGEVDGLVTSEGTIYPLLSRLRREGWVTTTWVESESGPPRRYYALTADGASALADFAGEWERFRDSVDQLLLKGKP